MEADLLALWDLSRHGVPSLGVQPQRHHLEAQRAGSAGEAFACLPHRPRSVVKFILTRETIFAETFPGETHIGDLG